MNEQTTTTSAPEDDEPQIRCLSKMRAVEARYVFLAVQAVDAFQQRVSFEGRQSAEGRRLKAWIDQYQDEALDDVVWQDVADLRELLGAIANLATLYPGPPNNPATASRFG